MPTQQMDLKERKVTDVILLVEAEAEEAWAKLSQSPENNIMQVQLAMNEPLWISRRIIASLEWLLQEASPASLIAMRDLMEEKLGEPVNER